MGHFTRSAELVRETVKGKEETRRVASGKRQ